MSPYVERASILARMGRALAALPPRQLDDYPSRFSAYRRASINRDEIRDYDARALANQRLLRAARRSS